MAKYRCNPFLAMRHPTWWCVGFETTAFSDAYAFQDSREARKYFSEWVNKNPKMVYLVEYRLKDNVCYEGTVIDIFGSKKYIPIMKMELDI